jgi:hypothetical protein
LNIVVSSIKLNNNALIFEESQPLSDTNPIHLVNKSNNFYSSLSQDQAGYIKIGIGKLAQTNVVTTVTGATINVAEATFTDLATVTTTITTGDTVAAKIHPERTVVKDTIENIEIATLPRFHQRYSVVSDDFRIKGITIPKGSIVVGTLLYNNKQEIPGNRQFQYYRIYDPNTGAMIKTFNLKTYKNSDCTAKTCFDMQQFATNKSNGLGARIFSEFSTEDLFGQLNPIEANKRWTLMQKDLERQSVTGIYKASKDWQLKLLKDLSDQDDVLFDNYFASIGNIEELEQVTTSIFEPILVNDQNAIDKYNHMVQSFKALVYARVSDDTESLPALRKKYEKAYDDYQNYMRARNEKTTIATTSTNTSSTSSTNTPSNTNKGNTNTPAANNGPKKPNNNGNKKKK